MTAIRSIHDSHKDGVAAFTETSLTLTGGWMMHRTARKNLMFGTEIRAATLLRRFSALRVK
jgi:hypothetical protein